METRDQRIKETQLENGRDGFLDPISDAFFDVSQITTLKLST